MTIKQFLVATAFIALIIVFEFVVIKIACLIARHKVENRVIFLSSVLVGFFAQFPAPFDVVLIVIAPMAVLYYFSKTSKIFVVGSLTGFINFVAFPILIFPVWLFMLSVVASAL